MDDFTEEEIEELQRRIESECKQHIWAQLEDLGVYECLRCQSLLFSANIDLTIETLEKYLLN